MPIESTTALVHNILMMNSASRNSDNLLFYLVCKKLLGDQGIDIENMGFVKLFLSLSAYGLPPFESCSMIFLNFGAMKRLVRQGQQVRMHLWNLLWMEGCEHYEV